jgi:hypothetical protein
MRRPATFTFLVIMAAGAALAAIGVTLAAALPSHRPAPGGGRRTDVAPS